MSPVRELIRKIAGLILAGLAIFIPFLYITLSTFSLFFSPTGAGEIGTVLAAIGIGLALIILPIYLELDWHKRRIDAKSRVYICIRCGYREGYARRQRKTAGAEATCARCGERMISILERTGEEAKNGAPRSEEKKSSDARSGTSPDLPPTRR